MNGAVEATMWNRRKMMESDAEGTILARQGLVLMRLAGRLVATVMANG